MAVDNPQQTSGVVEVGIYLLDPDTQARKRAATGLSSHRDTARDVVARPPDPSSRWPRWLLVFGSILLATAALLILCSTVALTRPDLLPPGVQGMITPQPAMPGFVLTTPGYNLQLVDDFTVPNSHLSDYTSVGQLSMVTLPEAGVYRMDIWPKYIGWGMFDVSAFPRYKLETEAVISPATPGNAAMLARQSANGDTYLFSVDSAGAYRVELWQNGESFALAHDTPSAAIFPAGQPNRLSLEDTGDRIRFAANQVVLFEVIDPKLPSGSAGIAAYAAGANQVTTDFNWVTIHSRDDSQ
ncbi:MAG: hypothetical protein IPK16_06085 [Anaerolineales bacterium]|nr:hypothetical protein [Anaerolineales bacterium]